MMTHPAPDRPDSVNPPFAPDGEPRYIPSPPRPRSRALEGILGLGLLLALAGIVTTGVSTTVEESRQTSAIEQMQHIVDGLRSYSHDTLTLPIGIRGRTDVSWLYGPGELPLDNPFVDGGTARPLSDALLDSTMGGMGWSGPYVNDLIADPWGRSYLVNVDGLINGRERAMVLSAGPDGVVSTSPTSLRADGDDVVLLLN